MLLSTDQKAKSLKMVHPGNQWLYLASDTTSQNRNLSSLEELLGEGENVAVLYNSTTVDSTCSVSRKSFFHLRPVRLLKFSQNQYHLPQSGLICYVRELTRALAVGTESSLAKEIALSDHVAEEEFEAIRLTKRERRREVLDKMEVGFT